MKFFGNNSSNKTVKSNNALLEAIENNDYKLFNSLLFKDDKKTSDININEKDSDGNYPFLLAVKNNNFDIAHAIIKYAKKNNIRLNVEEQNKNKQCPLLLAAKNNNMSLVYLIFDYAKLTNLILNVELRDSLNTYPIYYAVKNENYEMVKLFMDYAEDCGIVLDINDVTRLNDNPLIHSILKCNSKITGLILDYSKKHKLQTNVKCRNLNELYSFTFLGGIIEEKSENKKQNQRQDEKKKKLSEMNQEKISPKDENCSEAVALYDFKSSNPKELTVNKGDYIVVTDWTFNSEWVFGYKKGNPQELGKIPRFIINKCITEENLEEFEGDLASALYDFKGNTSDELDFKKNDYLRILDWNYKEGWAYGYVDGNRQRKGILPKIFIREVYYENQEYLPSYDEVIQSESKEE